MDLTLTGELANHLITMTKKDGKLAEAMASQYLKAVSLPEMAAYLLTPEVAVGLLADRLRKNPEQTLRQLQALSEGGAEVRGRRRTAKPVGRAATRVDRGKQGGKHGKRVRLSAVQVDQLKTKVRSYLGHNPWSNRKQLFNAVVFPSLAVYNRILGELRDNGEVQSNGEKSKTVYALKGARGPKAGTGKAAKSAKKTRKAGAKTQVRGKAKVAGKKATKRAPKTARSSQANIRLCPVPGCTNRAAPRFGMLCKEHKDTPQAERDRYFAARRAAKAGVTVEA